MKFIFSLLVLFSCASRADYVYMKETGDQKTIQWVKGLGPSTTQTLNDVNRNEWAIYPDISPNGEEFIYIEGPGPQDLHITCFHPKKKSTRRFHPVVKGMVLHPKFSKNGKFIFYSALRADGKNTIYYFDRAEVVSTAGTEQKDITLDKAMALDATEESYFPKPSADASFVVYQRNTGALKEIVFFDRMGGEKTVIAEGMSPALSFDERLIAFTSKKSGNWNISVYDRETKTIQEVTNDPGDEMAPTFMTDNTVVFASSKSGNFRLYKITDGKWFAMINEDDHAGDWSAYSPQFSGEVKYEQKELAPYLGNARSSFGTVMHEGKLYMAGGHQGQEHTYPEESFTDDFMSFDVTTNTWTRLAPRPVKAHGFQIVANGNYVYAFGGFTYAAEYSPKWKSLKNIDRYDIRTNKWETIGMLATPRSSNIAVKVGTKVVLAAGWDSTPKHANDLEGTFLPDVEIFDLETETVAPAAYKLPLPLRRALTGIELDGKVVMIGGLGVGSSHFELLNKVTSFDPLTGAVQEMNPLPFSTFAPAAEVQGKELFVFGGMFKTGPEEFEYVAHIYGMNLQTKVWRHTGRYLKETKGFSQVFKLDEDTLGILGGHHYFEGYDSPVMTFETFK